jgi:hypothetical protein
VGSEWYDSIHQRAGGHFYHPEWRAHSDAYSETDADPNARAFPNFDAHTDSIPDTDVRTGRGARERFLEHAWG